MFLKCVFRYAGLVLAFRQRLQCYKLQIRHLYTAHIRVSRVNGRTFV